MTTQNRIFVSEISYKDRGVAHKLRYNKLRFQNRTSHMCQDIASLMSKSRKTAAVWPSTSRGGNDEPATKLEC
jgi:hypothetical protein